MAETEWALILGASSGFGAATAVALAGAGLDVVGVHLDTRATLPNAERVRAEIEARGRRALFFNANAADPEKRREILDKIQEVIAGDPSGGYIKVLLHSLAFGTLRPYITPDPKDALTKSQLEMTLDVMANSLVYWVQDLFWRGLFRRGSKVFAMTSGGATRVIPYYGAVSAAKACLESHIRQLAFELAPAGVAVVGIRAGVTDTPALRKIPGHEQLIQQALRRNPSGRLTRPEDVAAAVVALCHPGTYWITGCVINVDGGEDIVG